MNGKQRSRGSRVVRLLAGPAALVLAAILSVALAGCVPVPTVVGRPAAVLRKDATRINVGGGLVDCDVTTTQTMPDVETLHDKAWGYGHASVEFGLGKRFGLQGGMNNGQGYLVLRYQPVGYPAEQAYRRRFPVDLSLECGASTWIAMAAIPFVPYIPYGDAHVGVNVSIPMGGFTPYASFRRHRVSHTFYDPDPEAPPTEGGYPENSFRQDMYFVGVEFKIGDSWFRDHRLVIEYFWGESTEPASGYYGESTRVRGLNVIVGVLEW